MIHTLEMSAIVPLPRPHVFAFFAEAGNLARITPPQMGFQVLTPGPITIGEGTVIDYRVRVFGLPMRWRSLIRDWDPPNRFIDVQLRGPYKSWVHTHTFHDDPAGTLVGDSVQYEIPFGPLGACVHPLVRRKLHQVFTYRQRAIAEII
jgi:ligand-binding SRPBCC domain-containing protein